ncbi:MULTISPECIES: hypothetical protein [unclassified Halorhodospira]|uniref:hypothetical protein n=1 Tax=unclassified Halorhodospira TaxID=2626748 RepID=UPI001EE84F8D|nr:MULTISPECIES: hypothetical protein [unclassified Halorhodospira]MCG5540193.1 hypothetical protein [Halorhodospira sp. M39old]MCG5545106.1 hypothetical protein [Halorhodospira sp. M38]
MTAPAIDADWLTPLVAGLASYLRTDGGLREPGGAELTPPGHYGQVFTALALHERPELGDWRLPLRYWQGLPKGQRGHEPFNRLGLRLLERSLASSGAAEVDLRRVRRAAEACSLGRRYVSNNWALLAATVRLLEAATARERHRRLRQLLHWVRRWSTPAGGFIDFPSRPGTRVTTPPAYHFKALLCLWIAYSRSADAEVAAHLRRMLEWVGLFLTPAGYCGGLGRSNHALYADACLLTVLNGAAGAAAGEWGLAASAMRERLERQRRPDGLFWLTPARCAGAVGGWDHYMHLSVYNAWAAGLWCAVAAGHPDLTPTEVQWPEHPWPEPGGCRFDHVAGVVRQRGDRWDLVISLGGQPVQGYSCHEADLRSLGVQPVHLELDGSPWLLPLSRGPGRGLVREPGSAGGQPLVIDQGHCYAGLHYTDVGWRATESGLHWWGEGVPEALWRQVGAGWFGRLREAVDWRWLGGWLARRAAVSPDRLDGHRWRLEMMWDGRRRLLQAWCTLYPRPGSEAHVLIPRGFPVRPGETAGSSLGQRKGGAYEVHPWPVTEPADFTWHVTAEEKKAAIPSARHGDESTGRAAR